MTSLESGIDPGLAALADAILIPPFPGTTPPPWILQALERGLAGVTLFGPNVVGDTAALSAALRSAAAVEPVIAIDEEGGDVTRVAYAEGSPYPGNAALGVVDDVALTRDVYAAIGGDLARLGININLAPCADVLVPGGSAVVGTRSFGSDPDLVARHVTAAVAGLQGAGVAACAKHFPGHGSTARRLAPDARHGLRHAGRAARPRPAAVRGGHRGRDPGHHARAPAGARADRRPPGDAVARPPSSACCAANSASTAWSICDALEMKAASGVLGIPEAAVLAVRGRR